MPHVLTPPVVATLSPWPPLLVDSGMRQIPVIFLMEGLWWCPTNSCWLCTLWCSYGSIQEGKDGDPPQNETSYTSVPNVYFTAIHLTTVFFPKYTCKHMIIFALPGYCPCSSIAFWHCHLYIYIHCTFSFIK